MLGCRNYTNRRSTERLLDHRLLSLTPDKLVVTNVPVCGRKRACICACVRTSHLICTVCGFELVTMWLKSLMLISVTTAKCTYRAVDSRRVLCEVKVQWQVLVELSSPPLGSRECIAGESWGAGCVCWSCIFYTTYLGMSFQQSTSHLRSELYGVKNDDAGML